MIRHKVPSLTGNFHQAAIERLRNYVPPPTTYGDVPLTRRAAVLLLLYADPHGDLRIVITIRAKTLSSCTYLRSAPNLRPAGAALFSGLCTTYGPR